MSSLKTPGKRPSLPPGGQKRSEPTKVGQRVVFVRRITLKLLSYLGLGIPLCFLALGLGGILVLQSMLVKVSKDITEQSSHGRIERIEQSLQDLGGAVTKIRESIVKVGDSVAKGSSSIKEAIEAIKDQERQVMEQMEDIRTQFSDVRKALEKTLEDRIHEISKQGEEQTSLLKPGDLPAQVEPKGTLIFWIVHAEDLQAENYSDPVSELYRRHCANTEASNKALTLVCYGQEQDKVKELFHSRKPNKSTRLDTPASQASRTLNWSRLVQELEKLAADSAYDLPRPWWLVIVAPGKGLKWWQVGSVEKQDSTQPDNSSAGGTAGTPEAESVGYVKAIRRFVNEILVFVVVSENDNAVVTAEIVDPELDWKFVRALGEQTDDRRAEYERAVQKVLDRILGGWGQKR